MVDRGHADADQVVGRQLRQQCAIDMIVTLSRNAGAYCSSPSPRSHATTSMRVILGSEERQSLMEEDIPLPFDVPAAVLK